jgi:hypothetical protein
LRKKRWLDGPSRPAPGRRRRGRMWRNAVLHLGFWVIGQVQGGPSCCIVRAMCSAVSVINNRKCSSSNSRRHGRRRRRVAEATEPNASDPSCLQ